MSRFNLCTELWERVKSTTKEAGFDFSITATAAAPDVKYDPIEHLNRSLKDHRCRLVFLGPTGVGKSELVNSLALGGETLEKLFGIPPCSEAVGNLPVPSARGGSSAVTRWITLVYRTRGVDACQPTLRVTATFCYRDELVDSVAMNRTLATEGIYPSAGYPQLVWEAELSKTDTLHNHTMLFKMCKILRDPSDTLVPKRMLWALRSLSVEGPWDMHEGAILVDTPGYDRDPQTIRLVRHEVATAGALVVVTPRHMTPIDLDPLADLGAFQRPAGSFTLVSAFLGRPADEPAADGTEPDRSNSDRDERHSGAKAAMRRSIDQRVEHGATAMHDGAGTTVLERRAYFDRLAKHLVVLDRHWINGRPPRRTTREPGPTEDEAARRRQALEHGERQLFWVKFGFSDELIKCLAMLDKMKVRLATARTIFDAPLCEHLVSQWNTRGTSTQLNKALGEPWWYNSHPDLSQTYTDAEKRFSAHIRTVLATVDIWRMFPGGGSEAERQQTMDTLLRLLTTFLHDQRICQLMQTAVVDAWIEDLLLPHQVDDAASLIEQLYLLPDEEGDTAATKAASLRTEVDRWWRERLSPATLNIEEALASSANKTADNIRDTITWALDARRLANSVTPTATSRILHDMPVEPLEELRLAESTMLDHLIRWLTDVMRACWSKLLVPSGNGLVGTMMCALSSHRRSQRSRKTPDAGVLPRNMCHRLDSLIKETDSLRVALLPRRPSPTEAAIVAATEPPLGTDALAPRTLTDAEAQRAYLAISETHSWVPTHDCSCDSVRSLFGHTDSAPLSHLDAYIRRSPASHMMSQTGRELPPVVMAVSADTPDALLEQVLSLDAKVLLVIDKDHHATDERCRRMQRAAGSDTCIIAMRLEDSTARSDAMRQRSRMKMLTNVARMFWRASDWCWVVDSSVRGLHAWDERRSLPVPVTAEHMFVGVRQRLQRICETRQASLYDLLHHARCDLLTLASRLSRELLRETVAILCPSGGDALAASTTDPARLSRLVERYVREIQAAIRTDDRLASASGAAAADDDSSQDLRRGMEAIEKARAMLSPLDITRSVRFAEHERHAAHYSSYFPDVLRPHRCTDEPDRLLLLHLRHEVSPPETDEAGEDIVYAESHYHWRHDLLDARWSYTTSTQAPSTGSKRTVHESRDGDGGSGDGVDEEAVAGGSRRQRQRTDDRI